MQTFNWDNFIGKAITAQIHAAEIEYDAIFNGANDYGVFLTVEQGTEKFQNRFFPWDQVKYLDFGTRLNSRQVA
jgi:hypothetical protein